MNESIITVEHLSKKFTIGENLQGRGSRTFRDVFDYKLKKIFGKAGELPKADSHIWALKDISFEISEGEVVGIIGRNGAGKSTLLKILSRITEPTEGRATLNGRVASLLEVGTGFNMELTGRENIFLNGAILGMRKSEISKKFDEIVDFAEIEKFLDTPVKRYSSGMYVRLAFAVAAHLEPDVLVVDEVLAVGDAEFQKKCLGKMKDVSEKGGRTVLFVSHNMGAVKFLCTRALLLKEGHLELTGDVNTVVNAYARFADSKGKRLKMTSKCGRFELEAPYFIDEKEKRTGDFPFGSKIKLRFNFTFFEEMKRVNPGFALIDSNGQRIFTSHLLDDKDFKFDRPLKGKVIIDTEIDLPSLAPGYYETIFGVRDEHEIEAIYYPDEIIPLNIGQTFSKNAGGGILWHTTKWKINGVKGNTKQ